jgi:hypothetical protein
MKRRVFAMLFRVCQQQALSSNIPLIRITNIGALSTRLYNLHIEAPDADPKQLASAVELAVSSGIGLDIEHHTEITDVYVLTAMPEAKNHLLESTAVFALRI